MQWWLWQQFVQLRRSSIWWPTREVLRNSLIDNMLLSWICTLFWQPSKGCACPNYECHKAIQTQRKARKLWVFQIHCNRFYRNRIPDIVFGTIFLFTWSENAFCYSIYFLICQSSSKPITTSIENVRQKGEQCAQLTAHLLFLGFEEKCS